MHNLHAIGERIYERIMDEGYHSPNDFAAKAKIPPATLNRVINGQVDPRLSTLQKIADGLGITLVTLVQQTIEVPRCKQIGKSYPVDL